MAQLQLLVWLQRKAQLLVLPQRKKDFRTMARLLVRLRRPGRPLDHRACTA